MLNLQRILLLGICLGVASLAAGLAQAAEILVPTGQATITAAIAAANNGDTITITNSAIYNENVTINKRVQLVAAAGQTPTIRGAGTASNVLTVSAGGADSRIGSNNGGRITLDAASMIEHLRTIETFTTASGTLIFENLKAINPCDPLDQTHIFMRPRGRYIMRNVEIDGANLLHAGWDLRQMRGSTMTLERVKVTRMRQSTSGGFIFYSAFMPCNIELKQCELQSYREVFIIEDNPPPVSVPAGPYNLVMQQSYLRSTVPGNFDTCDLRPSNLNITAIQCVFDSLINGGRGIFMKPAENSNLIVDHCDFYIPSGRGIDILYGNGRTYSITNSNFYTALGSNDSVNYLGSDNTEPFIIDWNNYIRGGAAAPTGTFNIGPPGIDPLYLDRPNRVFNYSDPQLLVSGQNGSAIGTNCDFSDITQDPTPCEVPPPPPPPARARNWENYM